MGRRGAAAAVVAVTLLAACTSGASDGTSDDPPPTPTSAPTEPSAHESYREYELYVAVGDSLAAGYQPANPGDRTDREGGYAGIVRGRLGEAGGAVPALVNVGCPGETTLTLVDGGRCEYGEGSQLAAAESVLRDRPDGGAATLVTVQVGANDVQRCVVPDLQAPRVDEGCVTDGLGTVRSRLPEVLDRLRAAAPEADVVVVDYYNPFAVAELLGPRAEQLAERSHEAHRELNAAITAAADAAGARVATVADAFSGPPATSGADRGGVGPICSLTWMCGEPPDVHATSAGYEVIAEAVLDALPAADAG